MKGKVFCFCLFFFPFESGSAFCEVFSGLVQRNGIQLDSAHVMVDRTGGRDDSLRVGGAGGELVRDVAELRFATTGAVMDTR